MSLAFPRFLTGIPFAAVALAALLTGGCHSDVRCVKEPIVSHVREVDIGDRWRFVLNEDRESGFRWRASCPDPSVEVSVTHKAKDDEDDDWEAPGTATVCVRIRPGFTGPSELTMKCARRSSSGTARTIRVSLYRRAESVGFWK